MMTTQTERIEAKPINSVAFTFGPSPFQMDINLGKQKKATLDWNPEWINLISTRL